MTPSPEFLRWWLLQREATRAAGVDLQRWAAIEAQAVSASCVVPEADHGLFSSFEQYAWDFRDHLEAAWRRQADGGGE